MQNVIERQVQVPSLLFSLSLFSSRYISAYNSLFCLYNTIIIPHALQTQTGNSFSNRPDYDINKLWEIVENLVLVNTESEQNQQRLRDNFDSLNQKVDLLLQQIRHHSRPQQQPIFNTTPPLNETQPQPNKLRNSLPSSLPYNYLTIPTPSLHPPPPSTTILPLQLEEDNLIYTENDKHVQLVPPSCYNIYSDEDIPNPRTVAEAVQHIFYGHFPNGSNSFPLLYLNEVFTQDQLYGNAKENGGQRAYWKKRMSLIPLHAQKNET
jgi:hypothetical protein